jgi:hypothetical protein
VAIFQPLDGSRGRSVPIQITADIGHLQIHEGNVRPVPPELLDGLASRRGLRHQLHVRLEVDQRRDALAQKRSGEDGRDHLRSIKSGPGRHNAAIEQATPA